MIAESQLAPYYSKIANRLDEIVPSEWSEIVMYAEELRDVRGVSFYYKTSQEQEYKAGGKIPDDYGVSTKFFLN
nr:immunity protein YezG family protein [Cellulosilyticum lentocellum]